MSMFLSCIEQTGLAFGLNYICAQIERHIAHASRGTRDTEHGCSGELAKRTGRGSGGGNFILEMCTSQEGDRWKEVSYVTGYVEIES